MKKYALLCCLLYCVFTFGQDTFTLKDTQLELINPEAGLVIKKGGAYYLLGIDPDIDKGKVKYHTNFFPASPEQLKKLKDDKTSIFATDIVKDDFKDLKNLSFKWNGDENDHFTIQQVNREAFIYIKENEKNSPTVKNVFVPIFLSLANTKILMLCGPCAHFIIPLKKGLTLVTYDSTAHIPAKNVKKKLSADILEQFSEKNNFESVYHIDTLGKKVGFRNYYGKEVIPRLYDSIVHNNYFIIAYAGKNIDIYNHALQKLDLPNVRIVRGRKYFPMILQILQNNKVKKICADGKKLSRILQHYDEMPTNEYIGLKIIKEGGIFTLIFADPFSEKKTQLVNTINVQKFFFSHYDGALFESEFYDNELKDYPVCALLNNGKYDINYIQYYLHGTHDENVDYIIPKVNDTELLEDSKQLPKNLDECQQDYPYFKIKKEGLWGYYPLQKVPRYKELTDFIEDFARFTLPNGHKGWLYKDGKEYLDE